MNDIVAPSAGQIGRSLQRIEARAKVTARLQSLSRQMLLHLIERLPVRRVALHDVVLRIDGVRLGG
jgi:hypothetical protein